jgi:predicted RNA methylase
MDFERFFDELYGGSRNSGFIQRMLAESPEDFDLDAIGNPSLWLQQRYPLYGEEKKDKDVMTTISVPRQIFPYPSGPKVLITEKENAVLKMYNKLERIRSKLVNKYRVYKGEGSAEVDKAYDDKDKVAKQLHEMINNRLDSEKPVKPQKNVPTVKEAPKRRKRPDVIQPPPKPQTTYVMPSKSTREYRTETEGDLLAQLKALYNTVDAKGWNAEREKEYGRLSAAIDEERRRQNEPEAEAPEEAVAAIEEAVADAPEEEVGKFAYNKEFFGAIDKMYNTSQRTTLRGKGIKTELFDAIVSIQNNYDLYPTPHTSLKPIFDDIDKLEGKYTTPLNFLEPSAGTGNIVRSIIDFGSRRKIKSIDAVELSKDLSELLKEQTTISNVYREDFLKFKPKQDYHYTIMNPPYTDGSNKTFWLEHVMKAMNIAWKQIEEGGGLQNTIYAIVPTTYLDDMWKKHYPNGQGRDDKYIGSEWEIPFDMEVCRKKKALLAEFNWLDEDGDFKPEFWIKKIGEITDFAKINPKGVARPMGLTVGIYRLFIGSMMGGARTHKANFLKAHNLEDRGYSLKELAKISGEPLSVLQQVYNRGIGAYKTNPTSVRMKGTYKKGVNAPMSMKLSKEHWAAARVYSYLMGNPKHDNDLR